MGPIIVIHLNSFRHAILLLQHWNLPGKLIMKSGLAWPCASQVPPSSCKSHCSWWYYPIAHDALLNRVRSLHYYSGGSQVPLPYNAEWKPASRRGTPRATHMHFLYDVFSDMGFRDPKLWRYGMLLWPISETKKPWLLSPMSYGIHWSEAQKKNLLLSITHGQTSSAKLLVSMATILSPATYRIQE